MFRLLKTILISCACTLLLAGFTPLRMDARAPYADIMQPATQDLFDQDGIRISEAYPNPAESFIELKYAITNPDARVKILFHNVLGVRVAEHTLKVGESSFTMSTEKFISGIYFYTLNVNDQNVITKKLVVKK